MTSKRSFASLLSIAVLAVGAFAAAAVTTARETLDTCCRSVVSAACWLFNVMPAPLPTVAQAVNAKPAVGLVRAAAYKLRQIKRDVMEMRPGYRHCPSI